jgi:hypothetical protein
MKSSRTSKRSLTWLLCAAFVGTWLPLADIADAGPDAKEIMNKVAVTRKLDGSEAVVKMKNIAGGQTRERELSMATKLYDGGKTEKRIYRFLAPADVRGTGVLVYDYENKSDDVWVFLPALRKTRRVVSSDQSNSFMGSEFSYGDLNVPSLDDFNYKLLKEESAGGENCYVIEVMPKSDDIAKAEGYSKKIYWISKEKFVVRQGHYFAPDGALLKELKAGDVALLDKEKKRYRTKTMEMVNKKTGNRSVFETVKVELVPGTSDDYFTTRYLERP